MTDAHPQELRAVAFGDLDGGPCGVALVFGRSFAFFTATADRPLMEISGAQLVDGEGWQLTGGGFALEISGAGEAVEHQPEHGPAGLEQRCRVRGEAAIGAEKLTVDAPGVRAVRTAFAPGAYESLRCAYAWFDSEEAIAVLAMRPRKGKGHGRDEITASVLEATAARPVSEPRLSTTYGADGDPRRAGVELWLDEEDGAQYSRRAAGQAIGAGIRVVDEGFEIRPELFRWQSRGRDGLGLYLLVRAR